MLYQNVGWKKEKVKGNIKSSQAQQKFCGLVYLGYMRNTRSTLSLSPHKHSFLPSSILMLFIYNILGPDCSLFHVLFPYHYYAYLFIQCLYRVYESAGYDGGGGGGGGGDCSGGGEATSLSVSNTTFVTVTTTAATAAFISTTVAITTRTATATMRTATTNTTRTCPSAITRIRETTTTTTITATIINMNTFNILYVITTSIPIVYTTTILGKTIQKIYTQER